jgi:uncharacterized phage protein (TIGR01671 family)
MAREIKFRAWLKSRPTLCKVLSIHFDKITTISVKDGQGKTWFEFGNENAILMQYTGLKDKNGVEIYEGDVLEITGNHKPGKYIVVWDDYRVAWWGRNIKCDKREREYEDDYFQLLGSWQKNITKVIGNIYEHQHLLESNKYKQEREEYNRAHKDDDVDEPYRWDGVE